MSTLSMAPTLRMDDEDEPRLLVAFDAPAEADFNVDEAADSERERYDGQILAALVSP